PDRLELAKRLHELVAVHPRQQLGERLPVAVLAGERTAEGRHEVGRTLEERAEGATPVGRGQLEVDARVDAALAEVAVQRRRVAVPSQQFVEGAQVLAEPRRWHGPVLPAGLAVAPARWKGSRRQSDLAHLGKLVLRALAVVD